MQIKQMMKSNLAEGLFSVSEVITKEKKSEWPSMGLPFPDLVNFSLFPTPSFSACFSCPSITVLSLSPPLTPCTHFPPPLFPFRIKDLDLTNYTLGISRTRYGWGNSDALNKWSFEKPNHTTHLPPQRETDYSQMLLVASAQRGHTDMKSLWGLRRQRLLVGASRAFTLYGWLYFDITGSRG